MDWPIPIDVLTRSADGADRASESSAFFTKRDETALPLGILACKENAETSRALKSRWPAIRAAILLGVGGFGLLLHGSVAQIQSGDAGLKPLGLVHAAPGALAINLPPPNLLRPLSPNEAAKENAERPFVNRPDTPASRFVLRVGAADRDRALTCLTQAVYYEAASEGLDGGRAVAQVVLNRMRHPGYPASVCGVIYQGADRTDGCQFTFACDGSLLRAPVETLWARSRKIAEDALAGRVFAPIGHATHYHADYVLPYWADSLDKSVQIGRHIFYRLRSSLGDSQAFFQHYAGAEPEVPLPGSTLVLPTSAAAEQLASTLINDGLNGAARDVEKAAQPVSPLAVDSARGTLLADSPAPAVPSHRSRSATDCAATGDRKQLAPMSATDMRLGLSPAGC